MLRHLALALGLLTSSLAPASAQPPCAPDGPQAPLVRFRQASIFGDVLVVEAAGYRHLRFGSPCGNDQSTVSLSDRNAIVTEYVRLAAVGLALPRRTEHVLMIGLGGGTFTNLVKRLRSGAEIDAVDLNPVVLEAATRFFGVRPSASYRLHVADGAEFLEETERSFDLVFLDTYGADGMPERLGTQAYFESAVKRLRPGGVVVANFGLDEPTTYIALARRLRAAAGDALCLSGREDANLVVFAGSPETLRAEPIAARAQRLDAEAGLPFSLGDLAIRVRECL
jgi:spermidine synthase